MKKDNNNIELVVLNCFLRIAKEQGKYMFYRRGVKNNGFMKYLLRNKVSHESPFIGSSSTEEVIKTLEKITNEMAKSNGVKKGSDGLDKYEHVTMTINHLLHFFMEQNGVGMNALCEMGEEIYNLSCNKLFGDTLEDLSEREAEEVKNITDSNQLRAKLFNDFVIGISSGEINHDVSFDEYLKQHSGEFKKIKNENSEQFGQVLGKVPSDNKFMDAVRNDSITVSWLDSF